MYNFIFFFVVFIILKKDLSIVSAMESIIFTTIVFIINKLCIQKISNRSSYSFNIFNILKFIAILIKDIMTSSWNISKLIIKNMPISPVIKKVNIHSLSKAKTVTFANSVTLTPGTISYYIEEKELHVHALKEEYVTGIADSKLINSIKKI